MGEIRRSAAMSTAEGVRGQMGIPNAPPSPISAGLYDSFDGAS